MTDVTEHEPTARPDGRLATALASNRFVVTAEIGPPRGADPDAVARKAELLHDWVDAANITDNQGAHTRLASWGGSVLALEHGVEPVMQLTTRDRNRIALQSDLLAASAVGIPNVLLLSGDHPTFGDHPQAAPVFDLDSTQLVWVARRLRDRGELLSGRQVARRPGWLVGAVENPAAPPVRYRARRLGKKIAAGADFVQTQYVFDVDGFARWMEEVRAEGLHERCGIIAGVGPIRSVRTMEYMQSKVPGIVIPDHVVRRIRGVPSDRVRDEGVRLCAETVEAFTQMPGVAGTHVMAFGHEQIVPEVLERAGLAPRTARASPALTSAESVRRGGCP